MGMYYDKTIIEVMMQCLASKKPLIIKEPRGRIRLLFASKKGK